MANLGNVNYLLQAVIGGGYSDIEFLLNKIDEFNLEMDDVVEEAKQLGDKLEINRLIYSTFNLAANNFLDKVEEFASANDLDFDRDNVDIDIFCNYLDSFLNGNILNSDIDIMDFSNENLSGFINKVNNNK